MKNTLETSQKKIIFKKIGKNCTISKETNGIINDVFRIENKNEIHFCKIINNKNNIFLNNNYKFIKIAKMIFPEIYFSLIYKNNNLICLKNIENYFLNYNNITKNELVLIAKKLKQIHKIKDYKKYKLEEFKPLTMINKYKTDQTKLFKFEGEIVMKATMLFNRYGFYICHNDLNKKNILMKKNSVVFIDYDFVGINDYYFDIASFLTEGDKIIDGEKREEFIKLYFRKSEFNKQRLDNWIDFANLLWYYWAQKMFQLTNEKKYQQIGNNKLNQLNKKTKIEN